MHKTSRNRSATTAACVALSLIGAFSGGCATLAHQDRYDYPGSHLVKQCEDEGETCPWLAADFGLLLAGVVPGVVALAVDFRTGAWKHEHYGESHF